MYCTLHYASDLDKLQFVFCYSTIVVLITLTVGLVIESVGQSNKPINNT